MPDTPDGAIILLALPLTYTTTGTGAIPTGATRTGALGMVGEDTHIGATGTAGAATTATLGTEPITDPTITPEPTRIALPAEDTLTVQGREIQGLVATIFLDTEPQTPIRKGTDRRETATSEDRPAPTETRAELHRAAAAGAVKRCATSDTKPKIVQP